MTFKRIERHILYPNYTLHYLYIAFNKERKTDPIHSYPVDVVLKRFLKGTKDTSYTATFPFVVYSLHFGTKDTSLTPTILFVAL